ncbi:helix-turn-helix domain-containing protein [Desulfobotulus sp.]|uniref:helix-turn-helix domain-containing protein n=1 Tax=Desulfobotulus sp. TaxID=1940337 RepID=UPI002A3617B9|nr:helix-turn-helix domain-containing protein [Desulfobotulus sp.]MDY0163407.1 helix-turn-helix domain-containing protein [Desulfobotulus sp.]
MDVKDRIREWRQALGLTQAAFSEQTGVPLRTIKGYESGERSPGMEALASIAKTGVNLNWLLTGEGNMRNKEEKAATPEVAVATPDIAVATPDIPPELEPFRRQLEAIAKLVTDIPDPEKRAALMAEFSTRAQDAKQMAELKRTVEDLRAAQQKTG